MTIHGIVNYVPTFERIGASAEEDAEACRRFAARMGANLDHVVLSIDPASPDADEYKRRFYAALHSVPARRPRWLRIGRRGNALAR